MKVYGESEISNKLSNEYTGNNIILISPSNVSEEDFLSDSDMIFKLRRQFVNIFKFLKEEVTNLMKAKNGTILFLVRPLSFDSNNYTYAPIYNNAIDAFMKSLYKELNPFNINVLSVILPLSNENRSFKKFNSISLKYKGIPEYKQLIYIKLILNNSDIFDGQTISLGDNLSIYK